MRLVTVTIVNYNTAYRQTNNHVKNALLLRRLAIDKCLVNRLIYWKTNFIDDHGMWVKCGRGMSANMVRVLPMTVRTFAFYQWPSLKALGLGLRVRIRASLFFDGRSLSQSNYSMPVRQLASRAH